MSITVMKAYVPPTLKRRAEVAFAQQDLNFSKWAREQLEAWLQTQSEQLSAKSASKENFHEQARSTPIIHR